LSEIENLPTILTEISDIEGVMRTNRTEYNRNDAMQGRLRELYGAREGAQSIAADQSNEGMDAMAPVSMSAFYEAAPTGNYHHYLAQVREASDVYIRVPASERASFAADFERLPPTVVGAMMAVLMDKHTLAAGYATDDAVREFRSYAGGRIVGEWGQEARQRLGRARARALRVIDYLGEADIPAYFRWFEGLSDGQAAAVYRKLAA
jgi:hypothetical protein